MSITENYMTMSFIHVYFSLNPNNGYKIFEKSKGENKKEIKKGKWKLNDFNRLEQKQPQKSDHLKKLTESRHNLRKQTCVTTSKVVRK
jgi:pyruvate/2-oxoacid:ferredoxin oxidoreductase beta subunit